MGWGKALFFMSQLISLGLVTLLVPALLEHPRALIALWNVYETFVKRLRVGWRLQRICLMERFSRQEINLLLPDEVENVMKW